MAHQKARNNAELFKGIQRRVKHYNNLKLRNIARQNQATNLSLVIRKKCEELLTRDGVYQEKVTKILAQL